MITRLDIKTIEFLLKNCELNKIPNKFTLSSCLIYNGTKYGLSTNNYYTNNPLTKKYNYHNTHAEIATLFKVSKNLNIKYFRNSTLYVAGVGRSASCNILKSSKPCDKCQIVINNFNVQRLVYITSTDNKELTIKEELLS